MKHTILVFLLMGCAHQRPAESLACTIVMGGPTHEYLGCYTDR